MKQRGKEGLERGCSAAGGLEEDLHVVSYIETYFLMRQVQTIYHHKNGVAPRTTILIGLVWLDTTSLFCVLPVDAMVLAFTRQEKTHSIFLGEKLLLRGSTARPLRRGSETTCSTTTR